MFDRFGMTDDPATHHRTRAIVSELEKNGYIYKQIVHQAYCTKCKRFLPDRYVEGVCPHCGKPARGDECDQGCGKHLEPGEIKDPVCKVCGTKAEFRDQEHYLLQALGVQGLPPAVPRQCPGHEQCEELRDRLDQGRAP